MEETKNKDVDTVSVPDIERRPYRTPTLRTLGNIQSVVQHATGTQGDGGGAGASSS